MTTSICREPEVGSEKQKGEGEGEVEVESEWRVSGLKWKDEGEARASGFGDSARGK